MSGGRRVVAAMAAVLVSAVAAHAITGPEVLNRIRHVYSKVHAFQANFDQTFEWKLAGTTEKTHGRFVMKKPNRFLIESNVQTVVTDGHTVWSYSPATQQVIVNDYDPAAMPLRPDNFLFTFPDEKHTTYVGERKLDGVDCQVIDVVPQDSTLGIKTMRVWVDAKTWTAKKVQYTSINDDITTYVLKDVELNPKIPDSEFKFTPPKGTDVVDFRTH